MAIRFESVVALEALEKAVAQGEPFGYDPSAEELWIGEGPASPDRRTYVVRTEEIQSAMQAVVGVHRIREAFK